MVQSALDYQVSINTGSFTWHMMRVGCAITLNGIQYVCPPEDQFDGIAELTFETEVDREAWFKSAAILMDDEHNIFSKAIGYNTSLGNSQTYIDGIPTGDPNGKQGAIKFHVMVKKSDAVSVEEFRQYMTGSFVLLLSRVILSSSSGYICLRK